MEHTYCESYNTPEELLQFGYIAVKAIYSYNAKILTHVVFLAKIATPAPFARDLSTTFTH